MLARQNALLVVDDRDSPPVTFDAVSAEGPVHELVYLASANAGMQLVYGSEDAEAPSYDVAAIRAVLKSGEETADATLGEPVQNNSAGDGVPLRLKDVFDNPVVIGCVVCVLVALLAVALVRAGRRIDALAPEGDDDD
jgi:hypothetical protein